MNRGWDCVIRVSNQESVFRMYLKRIHDCGHMRVQVQVPVHVMEARARCRSKHKQLCGEHAYHCEEQWRPTFQA